MLTFNLGIVIGLLIGQIPLPIPGGEPFRRYATLQTGNDILNVGYVTVYPAAMITKILLAQVLLSWLLQPGPSLSVVPLKTFYPVNLR